MPLQPRQDYSAGIHRGLPTGDITRSNSSPTRHHCRACARCNPAQIRQVRAGGFVLRGVHTLVPLSLHLSVLLAGPGPSGSAVLSRLCQGSHPHPGNHAALSFNQPAATSWRRCPFITARFESASWRSMSVTHNDPARCGRSRDRRGRPMSACHDVSCVDGFLVGPRSRPVSWTSRRRCGRR